MSKIMEALKVLDPADDSHWTQDGLPKLDLVRELTELPQLTRKELTNEAPEFTRVSAGGGRSESPPEDEIQDMGLGRPGEFVESEDPVVRIKNEIKLVEEQIEDLDRQRNEISNEITILSRRRDGLQEKIYGGSSPAEDTKARLRFIRKQNQLKQERVDRFQKLVGVGVSPRELKSPKSPIERKLDVKRPRKATLDPEVAKLPIVGTTEG